MSLTIVVLDTRFKVEEAHRQACRLARDVGWRGAVAPKLVEELLSRSETLREDGLSLDPGEEAMLELSTSTVHLRDFVTAIVPDLHGHGSFAILPVSEAASDQVRSLHERFVDSLAWKLMELDVRFYAHRVGEA